MTVLLDVLDAAVDAEEVVLEDVLDAEVVVVDVLDALDVEAHALITALHVLVHVKGIVTMDALQQAWQIFIQTLE